MNERILELLKQAEEETNAEYQDESRRKRRLYNEILLPKFSEMIVQECANVGERYADGNYEVYNQIMAHFGLEEPEE
jgi:hypothetical protein